jgi:hypothetical protein
VERSQFYVVSRSTKILGVSIAHKRNTCSRDYCVVTQGNQYTVPLVVGTYTAQLQSSKKNHQKPRDPFEIGKEKNGDNSHTYIALMASHMPHFNNVAYLLKARTVEPEKQPLLANGSETTFVSRQRPRNKQRNNVRCYAADS